MPNLSVPLSTAVFTALEEHASASNLAASDYATRLIEDHLATRGLLDDEVTEEITLARSLVDRAMQEALKIVGAGEFRSSITFDTIQSVTADPEWLGDYAKLIRDDPFKTGSPRKQTINQNLGYFIKKALAAKSVVGPNGRPANVKVKGSIIQSYTPLTQS